MKPGNFESQIHYEAYREEFYNKDINANNWICNHGTKLESLNGQWHYAVDQYDTCLRARWFEEAIINQEGNRIPLDYNFDQWSTIAVPLSWNTAEQELLLYEGPIIYTRTFHIKKQQRERLFLKFHGIQYEAFIFINKKYLGCHKGGSTGFCVEITDVLSENNRILIVTDNTRRSHQLPALNTDWFNYGGIYRDVEILRLPEVFIKNVSIQLLPDESFKNIHVQIKIAGSGKPSEKSVARLEIPELNVKEYIPIEDGIGSLLFSSSPQLWSPENPKLYKCTFHYEEDTVR